VLTHLRAIATLQQSPAGEDASQALARADARLYEAKAAGRNCVR
jgi:PleD family two-component response regulator